MLKRACTHVIFDLDGVLLDTEQSYTDVTQAIVTEYGKVFDWSVKSQMMGRSPLEAATHLVSALELPLTPEEYLTRAAPLLEQAFERAAELAGARELVNALADRGVPLAVATSSSRRLFELKTRAHAWFDRFQVVVCGDDPRIGSLKPAPDIFLLAARELGATPDACLVFEDSIAGVMAARAAGMQVVAIPDLQQDRTRFAEADLIIGAYAELDLSALHF